MSTSGSTKSYVSEQSRANEYNLFGLSRTLWHGVHTKSYLKTKPNDDWAKCFVMDKKFT